jgi:hypothetical protein
MKRIYILINLFVFACCSIHAEDIDKLKSIKARSEALYVKPETLDRLMIELRGFETSGQAQIDAVLLDTYISISSGYAANNHFKQAYEVYRKFLKHKEKFLTKNLNDQINQATASISGRKANDDKVRDDLSGNLKNLTESNEDLESSVLSFKRNFSFALIAISSVFAIMLVGSGIKMINLRSRRRQSRDRMKSIHRLAVVGGFDEGIKQSLTGSILEMQKMSGEIQQLLKTQEQNFTPVKNANVSLTVIQKIFSDLKKNFD